MRVATIQDFWYLHFPGQQPFVNRTLNRALVGRILKTADHIVTASQATADDAMSHYHVAPERLTIVPLGVDTGVFRPSSPERVAETRAHFGLTKRYLLALDVFNPRKNFRTVLEAFAALSAEATADLEIVGIGRRRSTATDADPRSLAASLGISSTFAFSMTLILPI